MPKWIDQLRDDCLALPGSDLEHPFGDDIDVFKVGGKVFAVYGASPRRLTLKAEPERVEALQDEHECVGPGYHMNKRHWVTLDLARRPPGRLAIELVEDSYDLVRDSLPKSRRPPVG